MGMPFFNKPKEAVEILETPTKSKIPKPPEPPAFDINDRFNRIEQMIAEHHSIIIQKLEPIPEAIVLNEEELKIVPEEDKDTYLDLKKNNPEMAKKLLKGYGKK